MTNQAATGCGTPVLIGIPFDANSSFMRGTAEAPPLIREASRSDSTNLCTEQGTDLAENPCYLDSGDMSCPRIVLFETLRRGFHRY